MHTSPSTVRQCLSTITGVSSLVFVVLVLMLVGGDIDSTQSEFCLV